MLNEGDLSALVITLKLASLSTFVLLTISIPLAWWLARTRWRFRFVLDAMVALPLVLPPTVLGFYLLLLMGPHGPLGALMMSIDGRPLAFTFAGLVIGSVFYSLPFVVQPLQNSFTAMGSRPLEVAATLRAGPLDRFFTIALPLARPGILTAAVLGFAHTLGEFGVVLMIGGNIPGSTRVASIAIDDHVENLDYANAHSLSLVLIGLSFLLLLAIYRYNRRFSLVTP